MYEYVYIELSVSGYNVTKDFSIRNIRFTLEVI